MRRVLGQTLVLVLGMTLVVACAHKESRTPASEGTEATSPVTESPSGFQEMPRFHLEDSQPEVVDQELEYIPTEINPMVDKWIDYFQGRGRNHMERYLARSTRYEKVMKKVLRDNGLPEDLFYIALIESGFNSSAVSHAAAVGYWQFIRGTGKRYGLEISRLVDERRDPVLATQAAAEYFRGLYSVFGSWYLAMASYNAGENRVKREVVKHDTRDFWELVRRARLHKETVNYVPKFIAAKLIAKDPAKYGFDGIDYLPAIEFDTIEVTKSVNLRVMAEKMNLNYEDFKALNPRFKGEVAPERTGRLTLRVPPGQTDAALVAAQESVAEKVEYVADIDTQVYKIRRGDTISGIARRFRTSVAYLRDLNDMPRGKKLRVGSTVYVPDRTPLKERSTRTVKTVTVKDIKRVAAARDEGDKVESNGSSRFHVVQNGDSLYTIARKYGTTVAALSKANNLKKGRVLKVGVRLVIPGGAERGESGSSNNQQSGGDLRGEKYGRSRVHVVRRGENLSTIAARYGVSLFDLQKKNSGMKSATLWVGAKILIPEANASSSVIK